MAISLLSYKPIGNIHKAEGIKRDFSPKVSFSENSSDTFSPSKDYVNKKLAEKVKEKADVLTKKGKPNEAINFYKKSIEICPNYTPPYYNLARVYKNQKDPVNTIKTYQSLLKKNPNELEGLTLLGKSFKEVGDVENATASFKMAVKKNPKYDYASREFKKINNETLEKQNPELAGSIKEQVAKSNLSASLDLLMTHAPASLTSDIKDVKFVFDETDSLSGHQNIAQYENHNRKIVVTDDYTWAAPEVVAAYLVHESVHAKDRDGLSSIREEQDAYEESIKFWVAHNNGVQDPELDYAAELYKDNPQKLRDKVSEIYSSRDKHMPKYSPNHYPPGYEKGLGALNLLGQRIENFFSTTGKTKKS